MIDTNENKALEYLRGNFLHNIGMIRPIERGSARVLYAGDDGLALIDEVSGALMLTVSRYETGSKLLGQMPRAKLYLVHQDFMIKDFKEKLNPKNVYEDFTAAYFHSEPLPVQDDMSFAPLDISALDIVTRSYSLDIGEEYIRGRLESEALFGAYVGDEMVGFAGEHEEGSLGMLVIFEKHRRKGYASSLVGFGVNRLLERGLIPFSNIHTHNKESVKMHEKLGFTVSSDRVWWLF